MARERGRVVVRRIVRRERRAHHGGSWKVAYADFVTAMMALFMVLWILSMDQNVRNAIQSYFANPVGVRKGYSTGSSPLSPGNSPGAVSTQPFKLITRAFEQDHYGRMGARIESRLRRADALGSLSGQVEVVRTAEGLRIELVERGEGGTFFAAGSAELTPGADVALRVIAAELKATYAPIVIEGHTDAAPFGAPGYTNWELSTDRANAARRALEEHGLGRYRVREVRGHADRRPRLPERPLDPANRRVTILVPFTTEPTRPPPPPAHVPS